MITYAHSYNHLRIHVAMAVIAQTWNLTNVLLSLAETAA